jgi:hypothetical protein
MAITDPEIVSEVAIEVRIEDKAVLVLLIWVVRNIPDSGSKGIFSDHISFDILWREVNRLVLRASEAILGGETFEQLMTLVLEFGRGRGS